MPMIKIQFGEGGISIERDFEVVPRIGDIVHITRADEDFHLLIDLAQHSENPDGGKMEYLLHGRVITDVAAEMSRQTKRGRNS